MGDFRQEWYLLVVVPSGEPIECIHILYPQKSLVTKPNFRVQAHIKFVNWQPKLISEEVILVELNKLFDNLSTTFRQLIDN